jgi:pimeloyl-ACP methyl ester carboxylesterase
LFNDLQADPGLRARYQFWFYLYPTGNPFLVTAADLRQSLRGLRRELDPEQRDAAWDQMVFVGHSMGGLVSKLLTQESGDEFWGLVSPRPLTTVKASDETRDELQRVFYFEPVPGARRVIFLGTPHRGSALSPALPGRVLTKLVRAPKKLMMTVRDVLRDNPDLWHGRSSIPTSIDLLAPDSPVLKLLAARPAPREVKYHSVIGAVCTVGSEVSDGVVTYASAHVEGAESEVIVPAGHTTVHHHPRAILEVRRILHEHLREVRGPPVRLTR